MRVICDTSPHPHWAGVAGRLGWSSLQGAAWKVAAEAARGVESDPALEPPSRDLGQASSPL